MALDDIVVGLDGSQESSDALRWASGLAQATSASSLRALSTWRMPLVASAPHVMGGLPSQAFMADYCAENLDKAVVEADIDVDITREVRHGDSGAILANETAVADLVVVGRTGSGRRRGISRAVEIVLGSTARHAIHHAHGPVATVPKGRSWTDDPVVVVGVDGSPGSHSALRWAVENMPESATIHAIRAAMPYVDGWFALADDVLDRLQISTNRELLESIGLALAGLDAKSIERVEPMVVIDSAREALLDPGFDADVLVVGERGRGAVAARVLGSVSDHVVRYADCPVIVVPTTEEVTNG